MVRLLINRNIITILFFILKMCSNVRRYGSVAAESRWRVFLHSWCDAEIWCYLFILALAKTVTPPGGPRREPGRAVPPTTKRYSLATRFSRYGAAMTYTDLLAQVFILQISSSGFNPLIDKILKIMPNKIRMQLDLFLRRLLMEYRLF